MSNTKNKVAEPTTVYRKTSSKFIYNIDELDLTKQYTYADYLTWRFKERVELIKGWIKKMSSAPKRKHQKIEGAIFYELVTFFNKESCDIYMAPFDVRLQTLNKDSKTTTVVQPDICIICDKTKLDERGCNGAPDLIVEILSLSTSKNDYGIKFDVYQENGVKEYWIVNPELHTVEVYTLINSKYQLFKEFKETSTCKEATSVLFTKFKLNLSKVFEE